jgi:hypothetical protein
MTAVALEALQVLQRVPPETCGALVRHRADGSMAGAVLAERGRVCWVVSEGEPRRLPEVIARESGAVTSTQVWEVANECRRAGAPLGETLLARGLVSRPGLHRALLSHSCESLERLLREADMPWHWIEHAGYGYDAMLSFSPLEVVAGLQAIAAPARAAHAHARLAQLVAPGTCAVALERARGTPPLAQLGCEALSLGALADLTAQAAAAASLGPAAGIDVQIADLGGRAAALWLEDDLVLAVLTEGPLAMQRLLAQVAPPAVEAEAEASRAAASPPSSGEPARSPGWPRSLRAPRIPMATPHSVLEPLREAEGFLGACLLDADAGAMLAAVEVGAGPSLELAATGNIEIVRAKRRTMRALQLTEPIEDILITLGSQYHLLRPLAARPSLFLYLALDRSRANLALARYLLAAAAKDAAL